MSKVEQTALTKIINKNPTILLEFLLDKQRELKLTPAEILILQFIWLEISQGNTTPSNMLLAERSQLEETEIRAIVVSLIGKKMMRVLSFESAGKMREEYDVSLLINKCFETATSPDAPTNQMKQFIQKVEQEFSRKLTPIEIRFIETWVYDEHVDYPTLDDALTESILAGVKNFKYMNAIISDWQKNGQKTYGVSKKTIGKKATKQAFSDEEKELAGFDWISSLGELDE